MIKVVFSFVLFGMIFSLNCSEENKDKENQYEKENKISAVDISSLPEIRKTDPVFYDLNGEEKGFLNILEENGVNTIRLRIWHNPAEGGSGFDEVKGFSRELKDRGFKIWLTLHYSDTWADPGAQKLPRAWEDIEFTELIDSVHSYTEKVMEEISPDMIQIGNEINGGFLFPFGNLKENKNQFKILLKTGIEAVRNYSPRVKIILHYAGTNGAYWFYDQLRDLDYDMMGISYYPLWHGKSLDSLDTALTSLSDFDKDVVIAETAYPFTLGWNDWTDNIVGLENQLIMPLFPASPEGQSSFLREIKRKIFKTPHGKGFCYWGGELVAWKGEKAEDGSVWENQALFDFDNHALPILQEFSIE